MQILRINNVYSSNTIINETYFNEFTRKIYFMKFINNIKIYTHIIHTNKTVLKLSSF